MEEENSTKTNKLEKGLDKFLFFAELPSALKFFWNVITFIPRMLIIFIKKIID